MHNFKIAQSKKAKFCRKGVGELHSRGGGHFRTLFFVGGGGCNPPQEQKFFLRAGGCLPRAQLFSGGDGGSPACNGLIRYHHSG